MSTPLQFPLSSAPQQPAGPAPQPNQAPPGQVQSPATGTNAYVNTDIDAQVNKLIQNSPLGFLPVSQTPPGTPQPVMQKLSQIRTRKVLQQLGSGQIKEQQLPGLVQNGIITSQEGNAIMQIAQRAQQQKAQQAGATSPAQPQQPGAQPSQPNTMMSPAGPGVPSTGG
jgi:hypothetical protein